MKQTSKSLELGQSTMTLQTGILAEQATAAVLARLGDTMVLSTVVMGENDTTLDYFPLQVEYVERLYAGGRIKGSKWVKREGRPSDEAVLTARLIDRSIRPLFPKELRKDIQIVITVLSVDGENDPGILGAIATSAALSISKIPWNGPLGTMRVGLVGENENGKKELVVNPKGTEEQFMDLDLVVSSTKEKAVMIEAGARQVTEDVVFEGIQLANKENKRIIEFIEELVKEVGEPKIDLQGDSEFQEAVMLVEKSYKDKIEALLSEGVTKENVSGLDEIADEIVERNPDEFSDKKKLIKALDYVFKKTIREMILTKGKRPDGRAITEVRPISAQVGILPRTHGSAIFKRGQTQALTVATLGTSALEQLIESAEGEEEKRYFHHYSFPPYSVGETGRMGSPNRREIGHGALAEKALVPVIPPESKFPYVVRVVSEIMSSNGSTSQASVCGSTLALMDAGVPISDPVAGIAMGLMSNDKKHVVLTDIIGLEDFSGDMDFKVAGTKNGITAIQLDVKNNGLTDEIIQESLAGAREARLFILEKMLAVLSESRKDVSQYAPKIKTIQINVDKIGEVIGSGGKTIKNIIASTGATVDVEDDGTVSIASQDTESVEKAVHWIETLTRDVEKGEVFEGTVKRMLSFGAFVELVPGKEGMVHVSEMSEEYVKDPADVLSIGQKVKVRVKEVDDQGRINLSMLFGESAERKEQQAQERKQQERRHEDFNRQERSGGYPSRGGGRSSGRPSRPGGPRRSGGDRGRGGFGR